jgi:hypothetical protein
MQVGSSVSAYQDIHNSQVQRCLEDNKAHYIDDNQYSDCQTNGRSDLQADHDEAYKLGSQTYHGNVLANVNNADTEMLLTAMQQQAEQKFEGDLLFERQMVINAVVGANSIATNPSSSLSRPVQIGGGGG